MVRARKRFGQHFLEPVWVDKLMQVIAPNASETFLEIGPGRGALTFPLAAAARSVLAVEIDRDLADGMRRASLANVTVIDGDFLRLTAADVARALAALNAVDGGGNVEIVSRTRVAGNLPYNVASPILLRLVDLFTGGLPFADATVMLQHEVAVRVTAPPGTKDYGVLSVLVGQAAEAQRLLTLPPGAFRPVPDVTSAVVRLRFRALAAHPLDPLLFGAMVQAVFTRRRKTLANALKAFAGAADLAPKVALDQAELDGQRRPETLTIPELVHLADIYARYLRESGWPR
jgi:16S rRNA (adenine1518-N6/adenine1519-N6)-dimethyltransferase